MTEAKIYSPYTIRERLNSKANEPMQVTEEQLKKLGQAVTIALEACLKLKMPDDSDLTDIRRRLVIGFIFGKDSEPLAQMSSKELKPWQIKALYDWIGIQQTVKENGEKSYPPRPGWTVEANQIANMAWGWITHRPLEPLGSLLVLSMQASPEPFLEVDTQGALAGIVQIGGVIWTQFIERPGMTREEKTPEDLEAERRQEVNLNADRPLKPAPPVPGTPAPTPAPGSPAPLVTSRPSWMKAVGK